MSAKLHTAPPEVAHPQTNPPHLVAGFGSKAAPTPAAFFGKPPPATIIKSACRGDGRNTSAPNRATSNRAAAIDIISIAQHAKPNPSGQIELLRAQFTALSKVVKMIPSSSSNLPKSSGFVSVTCLPSDVLIVPRTYIFAHPTRETN